MTGHRFYGELAEWWPLVSIVEDYAEEAGYVAGLLRSASEPVLEVLELGSGGGHNAAHLAADFTMTLSDLSPEMVTVSRRLNPDSEHHVADMRTMRLGRDFDAVFIHDAVDYMTSEADLRAALETAFVHCRPGGTVVVMPDDTAETFEPSTDHGGHDADDGRGVRYLEWSWDPDPSDSTVVTEYTFLLRDAAGAVRSVHETHTLGLFPLATWLGLLAEVGFDAAVIDEETSEERRPRKVFVGQRPG